MTVLYALGPYQFAALGFSLTDRSKNLDSGWSQIPVAGGMDRQQWLGGKAAKTQINGVLFSEFGGQASLNGIDAAARNGEVLSFVALSGAPNNVFGQVTVQSITEDHAYIDKAGVPRKNAYSISLQAYAGRPQPSEIGSVLTFLGLLS